MKKIPVPGQLVVLVFCLFSCVQSPKAQVKKFSVFLRVPIQADFQKEKIRFSPLRFKEVQHATVLNYGIDLIGETEILKKINSYIGVGYFRNKFDFKRSYAHQLLNSGDSLGIGTYTSNYIYHILRFPVGLSYQLKANNEVTYKVGAELIINYTFQKKYNGGKPFAGANTKISDFKYWGNSTLFYATIRIPLNKNSLLDFTSYIRIANIYKKDEILYEDPSESIKSNFDAIGLAITYIFNSLKKHTQLE